MRSHAEAGLQVAQHPGRVETSALRCLPAKAWWAKGIIPSLILTKQADDDLLGVSRFRTGTAEGPDADRSGRRGLALEVGGGEAVAEQAQVEDFAPSTTGARGPIERLNRPGSRRAVTPIAPLGKAAGCPATPGRRGTSLGSGSAEGPVGRSVADTESAPIGPSGPGPPWPAK